MERCANCQRELTPEALSLGYCEYCGAHIANVSIPTSSPVWQEAATAPKAPDDPPTLLPGAQRKKRVADKLALFKRQPRQDSHEDAPPDAVIHDIPALSSFLERGDMPSQSASLMNAAVTAIGQHDVASAPIFQRWPRQVYIIIIALILIVIAVVSITSLLTIKPSLGTLVSTMSEPHSTVTAAAATATAGATTAPVVITTPAATNAPTSATGTAVSSGQPTTTPTAPTAATATSVPTWHAAFKQSAPDCSNPGGVSWNHLYASSGNVIACSSGRLLIQQGQTYYPEADLVAFPGSYDPKHFQAKVHAHFQNVNSSTYAGTDATLVVQAPSQSSKCGGYYWEIRPNGSWRLQSLSSGCAFSIVKSGTVGAAADYNLEVQVANGQLHGFINGTQVTSLSDSLSSGIVGLSVIDWAWPTAQVYYTSFEVDAWN
jgi:hypothetical protein